MARAPILHVGVCEYTDEDHIYLSGWTFDTRSVPVLGCPFMHDADGKHCGYLGWTFDDLKAISDAQMEIAKLETADPPL